MSHKFNDTGGTAMDHDITLPGEFALSVEWWRGSVEKAEVKLLLMLCVCVYVLLPQGYNYRVIYPIQHNNRPNGGELCACDHMAMLERLSASEKSM